MDLNENIFKPGANIKDIFDISKHTIASPTYQKLIDYTDRMEKEITDTNHEFTIRAKQNIRLQILLAFMNQFFINSSKGSDINKKEWNDFYSKMLNFADINQAENVYSKAFSNIISNMENIDIFQKDEKYIEDENERKQTIFNCTYRDMCKRGNVK
ncbi:hypothetical protein KGMB02408_44180 [Bacteroides faecalis]|uniref:Uncharacterized protein n=2 Tax=Bacteroides faecalis TaxID=2447885 RepID=A0A401M183_9BACE|nr:hypothetical protein KGMB02408_44180 [Bacteroides faecalis]